MNLLQAAVTMPTWGESGKRPVCSGSQNGGSGDLQGESATTATGLSLLVN